MFSEARAGLLGELAQAQRVRLMRCQHRCVQLVLNDWHTVDSGYNSHQQFGGGSLGKNVSSGTANNGSHSNARQDKGSFHD